MFHKNLVEDNVIDILSFCDYYSLINTMVLNKEFYKFVKGYIFLEYNLVINIVRSRYRCYKVRKEDFKMLRELDVSREFLIFLLFLEYYNVCYDTGYSLWYDNERFSTENHPPAKKYDIMKLHRYTLWYNGDRLNIINKMSNDVFVNLLNRYEGMGHDYSLFNIKGTDRYFLDFQGGSNGYCYDDNILKVTNYKIEDLELYSLSDAFNLLIPFN